MKKIFGVIICTILVIALVFTCALSVAATEYQGYNGQISNEQNQSNGSITVESYVHSHFTLTIPETIDTSDPNSGEVTVSNASLEDNYVIKVGIDNLNENHRIVMNHKNKQGVTAEMTVSGNYSRMANDPDYSTVLIFNDNGTSYLNCNIDYNAPAGGYEGVVTYSVNCCPNT